MSLFFNQKSLVRKAGFTLVELLVVITIIGILISLLLPAVQAAREAARRLQCANNLKQIGLALHNYHAAHETFPPGAIVGDISCMATDRSKQRAPWTVQILPHLEQNNLYDQFDMKGCFAALLDDGETTDNVAPQTTPLSVFKCPSDPAPKINSASSNYMGVQGGGDESAADCRTGNSYNKRLRFSNGVLRTNFSVRIADVRDGTTNTFMVGESRWWLYQHTDVGFPTYFTWASANRLAGGSSHPIVLAAAVDPINSPLIDYDSASEWIDSNGNATNTLNLGTHTRCFGSHHAGGCHFAMADASVQFFNDNLNLDIYRTLGNRSDGLPLGGIY